MLVEYAVILYWTDGQFLASKSCLRCGVPPTTGPNEVYAGPISEVVPLVEMD